MKNEFSDFQRYFKEYQKRFGLIGWDVSFKYKALKEYLALIDMNDIFQTATVKLNNEPDEDDKPLNIKKLAKHESIHLLIGRLFLLALNRFATESEIKQANEELVNKLENLIDD